MFGGSNSGGARRGGGGGYSSGFSHSNSSSSSNSSSHSHSHSHSRAHIPDVDAPDAYPMYGTYFSAWVGDDEAAAAAAAAALPSGVSVPRMGTALGDVVRLSMGRHVRGEAARDASGGDAAALAGLRTALRGLLTEGTTRFLALAAPASASPAPFALTPAAGNLRHVLDRLQGAGAQEAALLAALGAPAEAPAEAPVGDAPAAAAAAAAEPAPAPAINVDRLVADLAAVGGAYADAVRALMEADADLQRRLDGVAGMLDALQALHERAGGMAAVPALAPLQDSIQAYVAAVLAGAGVEGACRALAAAHARFRDLHRVATAAAALGTAARAAAGGEPSGPTCCVCTAAEVTHALVPCGHTYCDACAAAQRTTCYQCRTTVQSRMRVYLA